MNDRIGNRFASAFLAMVTMGVSSCATKEEMTRKLGKRSDVSPVRSSFGYAEGAFGGQAGGGEDEEKIRSKFVDSGWKFDEEGNITGPRKKNLYSDNKEYGRGREFDKKQAYLKNRETAKEVFRTPEYLDRQEYRDGGKAREGGLLARESDTGGNRPGESGEVARESGEDSPGFLRSLNPFRNRNSRAGNKDFATGESREASARSATATAPVTRGGTDMRDAAMTVDDVKKLLHPEGYD